MPDDDPLTVRDMVDRVVAAAGGPIPEDHNRLLFRDVIRAAVAWEELAGRAGPVLGPLMARDAAPLLCALYPLAREDLDAVRVYTAAHLGRGLTPETLTRVLGHLASWQRTTAGVIELAPLVTIRNLLDWARDDPAAPTPPGPRGPDAGGDDWVIAPQKGLLEMLGFSGHFTGKLKELAARGEVGVVELRPAVGGKRPLYAAPLDDLRRHRARHPELRPSRDLPAAGRPLPPTVEYRIIPYN